MKRILEPGRNCMGIFEAESAGVLVDARDYYRAFYHAALSARKYILVAGWQFDSEVELLRGREAGRAGRDVRLLPFLDSLCDERPWLEVRILAWDFSILFAPDHELAQELKFNWATSKRLRFLFDANHPIGASHHMKLAVVDGAVAFTGGLDICSRHWDTREHPARHPDRVDADGREYEPYHDVQAFVTGPAVGILAGMFRERWLFAGGGGFEVLPGGGGRFRARDAIPVRAGAVAISRTAAKTANPPQDAVQEIKELYADAVAAAERLIYIENQYFTSRWVFDCVDRRMKDAAKPKLEVVIVLPRRFNAFMEEVMHAVAQVRVLKALKRLAVEFGHSLGIFYASSISDGYEAQTYIHSKVLIVDDRLMSVGSANISNRSMSLDTELNLTWEAAKDGDETAGSIRAVRGDLLAEHTGRRGFLDRRRLERTRGLVEYLNSLADGGGPRLKRHNMETLFEDYKWLKKLTPGNFGFDPEEPIIGPEWYESVFSDDGDIFSEGILNFKKWADSTFGRSGMAREKNHPPPREDYERSFAGVKMTRFKVNLLFGLLAVLSALMVWLFIRSC